VSQRDGGRSLGGDGEPLGDVVDDLTFDLLQALTSKLEAIDAYREYAGHDGGGVFDAMLADEIRHAEILLDALRGRLA
jgi:hypothetical protein